MEDRLGLLNLIRSISSEPGTDVPGMWLNRPMLGFDTETTGVDTDRDRIVTVALVASSGMPPHQEVVCTWLIDPSIEIPEGASAVHGVSTEFARTHGIAPLEALDQVATILAEAQMRGIPIVAFNARFDLRILEAELVRNGLPTLAQRAPGAPLLVLDPLTIDRGMDRWRKGKRKLVDMMALLGIKQGGRLHTADVDVSMTLQVLRALARKHPSLGKWDLASLQGEQERWHRVWAQGMNGWLARQGKPADIELTWP
ncbi:DNA polymerase III subunit epsilon [Brachybacterium sp. JHP9]|uniref:DNA polymerase III subunit epsilon n=1 Tax=Brachybacterium equifaecis TaxID=2910770 RepID=A0ABT0R1A3_9MICO|nr:exonuclease domain-containing protein [Brachybacterium equifaecis]MCL6423705.1 DNA polymerase III subunit epsilon [Brachybacterium equifaecis]